MRKLRLKWRWRKGGFGAGKLLLHSLANTYGDTRTPTRRLTYPQVHTGLGLGILSYVGEKLVYSL